MNFTQAVQSGKVPTDPATTQRAREAMVVVRCFRLLPTHTGSLRIDLES